MNGRFTEKAKNALNLSLAAAGEMGHTYIGSEHILIGLASVPDSVSARLLESKGLTSSKIRQAVAEIAGVGAKSSPSPADMTPRVKRIIEISAELSGRFSSSYIGTEHLLLALLGERDCVAVKLITSFGVNPAELRTELTSFLESAPRNAAQAGGDSADGAPSGISGTLAEYGRDLTAAAREGKIDPVVGRDEETARVVQILSRRTKNNPCLIGEPGVGKTAVVEGLAQRIADGNVPETLRDKSIVTLSITSMIAGAKYRGEFEERLKGVMDEVKSKPDVILFIDEIHTIIGAGAAEGAVDAANILKPALARGEIQLIGATTLDEYRKHIEKDSALERRFQPVTVGEPSTEDAIRILFGLRDKYEAHHKLKITDEAIEAAVRLSQRYINDRYLPDKAIDLIDEAASKIRIAGCTTPADLTELEERIKQAARDKEEAIKSQNFESAAGYRDEEKKLKEEYDAKHAAWEKSRGEAKNSVTAEDIADIITLWTKIPVSRLLEEESERLSRLGETLRARVIGQDEAVDVIARAIQRGRIGLGNPRRPIGSFMFLGPTGVGKTELCKALAEAMFGAEGAMIRIDMSEYMEKHSVSKLIGSPPGYVGYDDGGQLTERVRRRPYSVILFDEIEKAHPDVFNILLQILEDGLLTDSQGRHVDFRNTVIILTSNVGASGITEPKHLGFTAAKADGDDSKSRGIVMAALKATFKPEFLNRLDEIIVFNKLSEENIRRIASIMLDEVKSRIEALGISFEYDDSVAALVSAEGFDPIYGARPLRRAIVHAVEDSFSAQMLDGAIKAGDSVKASAVDGKVVYTKQTAEATPEKKAPARKKAKKPDADEEE